MAAIEKFHIPEERLGGAHLDEARYLELYRRSIESPEEFWSQQAREFLAWDEPWHTVLEHDYRQAHIRWFSGGKLNVAKNCIDRHLESRGEKTALIWEGNEPGEVLSYTYSELYTQVCKLANVLKDLGVKKGDRVAIYMPMVPELMFSMLACARIGAIHTVVFGGFSAEALRGRIVDCSCRVVITSNVCYRGTKAIPLKQIVDEALSEVECVETVLVHRRAGVDTPMKFGRDVWLAGLMAHAAGDCPAESMDAEDPLFILYTSGSTGKPKGVLHTQGGYLLYAGMTHRYVFDYREDEVYFCAADCGWVTGHSYVVYGPLANGATTVMFESTPTYPDAGRYWDVIDRHQVNIFYTAPTAIRAVAKEGDHLVGKYSLESLRVLGSVGEPINRDAWLWYFNRIGKGRCPVVDTWWQTETGGILITPLPGINGFKPGSALRPFFGVQPCLVDDSGNELQHRGEELKGKLCIKFPWPGQMRSVYGDHDRFHQTYFSQHPGKYFTGDACILDAEGHYWITGRVDDVLNVSGHRLGTAEIESALVQSGIVAEAAVVGAPHEIKGTGIYSFCVLKDGVQADDQAREAIKEAARRVIGGIAAPDTIQFVTGLPKTRSGKIMRRILRKIAAGDHEDFGDISTLADPAVVSSISEGARSIGAA